MRTGAALCRVFAISGNSGELFCICVSAFWHIVSSQVNVANLNVLAEEHGGAFFEALGVFGGVIVGGGMAGALGVDVGVAVKVVDEGCGHVVALCHEGDARWGGFLQCIHQ